MAIHHVVCRPIFGCLYPLVDFSLWISIFCSPFCDRIWYNVTEAQSNTTNTNQVQQVEFYFSLPVVHWSKQKHW